MVNYGFSRGILGAVGMLTMFCLVVGACRGTGSEGGSTGTAASARPASTGLDEAGQMHVSEGDRCPVCAMDVSEHARFASAIELRDGRTFYFCGTGCMIRSWLHPEVFLGVPRASLQRAVVKEYFNGEHVDALKAVFVAGSDVVGPMGPALVPLKTQADVDTFMARHKGKTTFRVSELDDGRWEAITGKRAIPEKRR